LPRNPTMTHEQGGALRGEILDATARLLADGIANVFTDPEYLRVIRPDEAKFCDLDGCTFAVTTENLVHDPAS